MGTRYEYADDGDLKDDSSSSTSRSTSSVASIMVTNTTTPEEQITNLTRAIEGLAKHVQDQDSQICKLMNKIENTNASHMAEKQVETHDEAETFLRQQSNEREKSSTKKLQVSLEGLIPVDQLKEFIMGTSKTNSMEATSHHDIHKAIHSKIDNLMITVGYQQLKYQ
ncbi:hypothetical protein Sango_3070100 [Sesamum angolense]|uniref:Ty3-gypsy retrotransposon protein n=1 Tax=Sesamum angolense TaxID=2727404 RepID=A0AAE1T981_9LAMI|nr:hypothetical protein Sango_3070100 [Sesamum angolense]